jgi:hypothetical protein
VIDGRDGDSGVRELRVRLGERALVWDLEGDVVEARRRGLP